MKNKNPLRPFWYLLFFLIYFVSFQTETFGQDEILFQKLSPPEAIPETKFGEIAIIKEDLLFVGAPYSSGGKVFYYTKVERGWEFQETLLSLSNQPKEGFGFSMSLKGDLLAVGAPFHNGEGPDTGKVYLFKRIEDKFEYQFIYKDQLNPVALLEEDGRIK
jgi:hypothetical protein